MYVDLYRIRCCRAFLNCIASSQDLASIKMDLIYIHAPHRLRCTAKRISMKLINDKIYQLPCMYVIERRRR